MAHRQLKLSTILKLTSAAVALATIASPAVAADCFGRSSAAQKAGNTTAVVGPEVGLRNASSEAFNRPTAGDDVFTGDRVRTGAESHLQLKLCDWSTYSFPPESESRISEFYEADGAMQRRLVNFVRGGFRLASGRNTEPGSTEVKIQESGVTMGVRGTNVILAEVDGVVYALLEGPSLDNTALTPKGRVEFWTDENRDTIIARLFRPGWVVTIGLDGVSEPFRATPELLARIYEAFLPAAPGDQDADVQYEDAPEENSGQGAQEGESGVSITIAQNETEDEDTENLPEQPASPEFMLPVGEILPLDALEQFAAQQANPDGHVFALAPAQLFVDSGAGPVLQDTGVVLIQINIDWASRTIAPEALASFIKFDFSVIDPTNLTDDVDFPLDNVVRDAFIQALIASTNIPFASGDAGLAVFLTQAYSLTVRQGAGPTVAVDVEVDFTAADQQSNEVTLIAQALGLQTAAGAGPLAYFNFPLADVFTLPEFDGFRASGAQQVWGFTNQVGSTLGTPGPIPGVGYAQIEVNFDNRTIGGPDSFLLFTGPVGAQHATAFLPLDQVQPFSAGLFNLALYPLGALSGGGSLVSGQALFSQSLDFTLIADIAAILDADSGAHLYAEVPLTNEFFGANYEVATIAELDAAASAIIGALGGPNGHFSSAGSNFAFSEFQGIGGTMSAQIDINFANREIGGGNSFVMVDVTDFLSGTQLINFTELLGAVGFGAAVAGSGAFALGDADFSGTNIQSALFMIRNDILGDPTRPTADLMVTFTGAGGELGQGVVTQMSLQSGSAMLP